MKLYSRPTMSGVLSIDTLFILEITVRRKRVAMVVPSPGSYW